jgi:hypothetical protein
MARSPQYRDGRFHNPQPLWNDYRAMLSGALHASPDRGPSKPLPTVRADAGRFAVPPASGLRVTWMGHSSMLVEIDGHRVLTDPEEQP